MKNKKSLYISPYLMIVVVLSAIFIWLKKMELATIEHSMNLVDEYIAEYVEQGHPRNQFLLVDVRTSTEYNAGHCVGAVNVSCDSVGNVFPLMEKNRKMPIFIYCQTGKRATLARETLLRMGYENVVNINELIQKRENKK